MDQQVESLSEILSAETTSIVDAGTDQTAVPEDTGRDRDEFGRFAPKANEPAPVAADATAPTEQQPPAADAPQDKTVPLGALTEARGEIRELRQQIQQLMLRTSAPQPAAQPAQPPQAKRELWDDPDGFVADRLTPFQQQQSELNARLSHVAAVQEFGREAVTSAHKAVTDAIERGELSRETVNGQLAKSRDPVGDIIRWHQGQTTKANMTRIGNDPDAWLKAEVAKMLADPAQAGEMLKTIQQNASTAPAIIPPRSQAPTPPPSIARMPGGSGNSTEGIPTLGELLKGG